MRRSPTALRISRVPRLAIAKIAAITLLTLILLPFTAPFQSYDLSGPQSDHSGDQLVKSKLGADEQLVGATELSPVPVDLIVVVVVGALPAIDQVDQPQIYSSVLRL